MKRREFAILLLLAFGALLVHGYHPAAEDGEIYVPGIVKILHPSFYPLGGEFFEPNSRLTIYPHVVASTVQLAHLPLEWALFFWHIMALFLLLLACRRIAMLCFSSAAAQWAAVVTVAALLTIPVAGTALYIFDQYPNPRAFSTFAILFAISALLEKNYRWAVVWIIVTALFHPFMSVFGIVLLSVLFILEKRRAVQPATAMAAGVALLAFRKPSAAYWQVLESRRYYFLLQWSWYEWLGALAPLVLLWWFRRIAMQRGNAVLQRLCEALLIFAAVFLAAGIIIGIPHALEILIPYQPMRSFQLVYVLFFLIAGGLIGEFFLRNRKWAWGLLFIPLCAGMCFAQYQLFPGDRHVEWPGAQPKNEWLKAFDWVRVNTPTGAVFALDPNYMALPNENYEGFRAVAERSSLADNIKDCSASVLYPWLPLADDCRAQVQAAQNWGKFTRAEFERLKLRYGVTWTVLQQQKAPRLACPYHHGDIWVCRID